MVGGVPTWGEGSGVVGGGSVPTSREGSGGPVAGWVPVPMSLQERYRYVGQVDGGGGEANLYRVHPVDGPGCDLLLKLYLGSVELDRAALESVSSMGRHVVGVVDYGRVAETGQWFEVQEFVPHGDLLGLVRSHGVVRDGARRLPEMLVRDLVGQLHAALVAFHGAVGAHHDVKPSNVLVRSQPPELEVVLADFGLAVATERSVVYQSRRAGTIAYDSPESLGAGQGGPKRDWWALGMTVAHLAGGRHPFEHPSRPGTVLTDAAIRDHLHNRRDIDLDAVPGPELRALCRGLTRYDPAVRWGGEQVSGWLAGREVAVPAEPVTAPSPPPAAPAPRSAAVGIDFAGERRSSRAGLAAAMVDDWRAAAAVLGTASKRQSFVDDVAATFGGRGLERFDARWAGQEGIDRAIVEVVVALDPGGVPPVVKGYEVSQPQLGALVRLALSDQDQAPQAREVITLLYDQRLLGFLGHLDDHRDLFDIDARWHETVEAFDRHLERAREGGIDPGARAQQARILLLGAVAEPQFTAELAAQRDETLNRHPEAKDAGWFAPLADTTADDPATVTAALLLAEAAALTAREHQQRQREQQAQQRAQEQQAERERQARARRAEEARREREERVKEERDNRLIGSFALLAGVLVVVVLYLLSEPLV